VNGRKNVMLVFGTRPEAIKMAPVYHALKRAPDRFDVTCCVSAQHRQMLDQVLATFAITPDIDLDLMVPGQDLFDVTSAVLLGMRKVLAERRPDLVLVHGDTTTSMAAALACFYAGVAVGHVEAGLRTWDLAAPFPEEFNRQLTTKLTRWHFAPTATSRENLLREGVDPERIVVTGNTVIDALEYVVARLNEDAALRDRAEAQLARDLRFDWKSARFVLITGHRRENFGEGFLAICRALRALSVRYPDVHFVYPVHLNPNVRDPVNALLRDRPNIWLTEPLTYEPFVSLLKHCYLVLTDSGGIQEEAPSLGKPVLVMREVTERPEAVDAGTVRLVGADEERIVSETALLLDDAETYAAMSRAHNPYGDGLAAARIRATLEL
jgi:UDP-N-acetylglucosamine 2-epimerase (non-hydrolysing)